MTVHHQQEQVIAWPMPSGLGGIEQAVDLGCRQEILTACVGIDGRIRVTLYILPADRLLGHAMFPWMYSFPAASLLTKCAFCNE